MNFDSLLSRADTALLQELLGDNVVRLLHALDPEKASAPQLKRVLVDLHSPQELLMSATWRPMLLELLRREEAATLVEHLGLETAGDPFDRLREARVRRNSATATLLHSYFELPVATSESNEAVPTVTKVRGGYELFPHQRRVLRRASNLLASAPFKVLIHMPTGSGKTRTAMSLVAEHLRRVEPGFVLWLAASEELCEQAVDEFGAAWGHSGDRPIAVHRWWGADPLPSEAPADGVAVAGLAKVYARCINELPWQAKLGDRVSLLVFDEAHQAIAPTYRHVVEAIRARNPDSGLLGLSATPGRTYNDVNADAELATFFSRKKVILEVEGYANPMEYLIADGYLARPTFRRIDATGPVLTDAERTSLGTSLDIPPSVLKRLADDHLRNLQIAREVVALAGRHRRILVFAATVEHAELLAIVLEILGVPARAVTGATPSTQRSDAIRWYRATSDDGPRVLTNFGVLTTGFDAPKTSAAVIARPTQSLVLYSQMVGRAIRGEKANGNRKAEIVTVVDTGLPGFRSLSEAFTNWEDVWAAPKQ